ncbi:MAG: hypothetical protein KA160_09340 [Lacibacter sp.]|nr:hypothetical protein [Lacibacter sp.]
MIKLFIKLPFLLIVIFFHNFSNAQTNDPFVLLQQAARKSATVKSQLSKVDINRSNPKWQAVTGQPIAFVPFTLTDKNGQSIAPGKLFTLKSGKQVTAQEYLNRINDIEKKLNQKGKTLRKKENEILSRTVTSSNVLAGKAANFKVDPPRKSREDVAKMLIAERTVGATILKPYQLYTKEEKDKFESTAFIVSKSGISERRLGSRYPNNFALPPAAYGPLMPLKLIDDKTHRWWMLGDPATFEVGIEAELLRYIKIYPVNIDKPETSLSEFKFAAKGKVFGSVFDHRLNLLNASAEYYAPSNATKKMHTKIQVECAGITIFNHFKEYDQEKTISGFEGKEFDKSFSIKIPIGWGIDFLGTIGAKGRAGFQYRASVMRGTLAAFAQPVVDINGYAEAGIEFLNFIGGGVGGRLTLIKGDVGLQMMAGIWAQSRGQIVLGVDFNYDYSLEMLSGDLYCYFEIDYFFDTYRKEHTLFSWEGFQQQGTVASSSAYYTLANEFKYADPGVNID